MGDRGGEGAAAGAFVRFGVLSAIGTLVYATIVASIGYGVGTAWHTVAHDLAVAGYVIFAVAVVAIVAFIYYRVRELRRESRDEEPRPRPASHRAPRG
jgi:membrane protein DedA with SNARE-associated domain